MRRLIAAAGVLVLAAACAQQGAPPGGPPDHVPPVLMSVSPDSGMVMRRVHEVTFRFNEVLSETPRGAATLSAMFLISPVHGEPRVSWHRSTLDVRPSRGFQSNTVYTVTMLPGITDLRGNPLLDERTVVFSTGAAIPNTRLAGILYDWVQGTPPRNGGVEAIAQWDSTRYVARVDSAGRFEFLHVPAGLYVVRGYLDQNTNRQLDPHEAWDSARVALQDSTSVQLFAFVHDSTGPGITSVVKADSATVRVTFDRPLDPAQSLGGLIAVLRSDSTSVPVDSIASAAAARAVADTAAGRAPAGRAPAGRVPAARADTARGDTSANAPPMPRPRPVTAVVVHLGDTLVPGREYRVVAHDARGLMGVTRTTSRVLTIPVPAPRDSTQRDSTQRDSTQRDTTQRDTTARDTTARDTTARDTTARPPRP